ncbi:L-asparaginase [Azospirillum fermentarium]|uniref:asparaginase n=1 Tax=Azospirillum fermentarium TaxID=1233114 RepID=UPI00222618D8|nr:asparaginase [Azospirillum fermentarium]MCW2249207.1 L-asparaginase [Azospirillum fermentarium]
MTANVLVIYTGGTIGSVPSDPADPRSPLRPADPEQLAAYVPNPLNGIGWDLVGLTDDAGMPVPPLDSSSVGPKHWVWMAQTVAAAYDRYDGFVILHGTDTMAYTGSALSFLLRHLGKPVVVTGSQIPIFRPRTDAVVNLINALSVAGYKATGLPCVPEVCIAFADRLLRANRATKVSATRWAAFDSPNLPPLGRFDLGISIENGLIRPVPPEPFTVHRRLNRRVMVLSLYPGMAADQIAGVLALPDIHGYVLRSFGAGNAPEDADFLDTLAAAVRAGKTIVTVTQCAEGAVEMGLYAAGAGLAEAGVLSGGDMTTEAAQTKLMWLLANVAEPDIAAYFLAGQCGERSV